MAFRIGTIGPELGVEVWISTTPSDISVTANLLLPLAHGDLSSVGSRITPVRGSGHEHCSISLDGQFESGHGDSSFVRQNRSPIRPLCSESRSALPSDAQSEEYRKYKNIWNNSILIFCHSI